MYTLQYVLIFIFIGPKDSFELSNTAPGSNSLQGEFDYFSLQSLWNHDIYIAHVVEPVRIIQIQNKQIRKILMFNNLKYIINSHKIISIDLRGRDSSIFSLLYSAIRLSNGQHIKIILRKKKQ